MEMKKMLAGWSKVCPGCNIARKYPESFVGKKVRAHWEKGCVSHDAYVEHYGADEPSPKNVKAKKSNNPKKNNNAGKKKNNPHKKSGKARGKKRAKRS